MKQMIIEALLAMICGYIIVWSLYSLFSWMVSLW